MRCLSVSQPYADLIVKGRKMIELRRWNTKYRGEFLVHAPLKIRKDICSRLKISEKSLRTGAIVGKAELYDVKVYASASEVKADSKKHLATKEFWNRKYGFLLRNTLELKVPIPYKGKLGFFEVSLDSSIRPSDIKFDLFEEEYRYQWVGRH
ncbi:MAG: ASCH domain-containing protein [Nitrosopumilaceae archaeon]